MAGFAALPCLAQQFGHNDLAPYIPTPQIIVERMLEAGRVKPGDVVYDLGSGDGRIVITAAQKFGARAVGVEIRPDLCRIARQRIKALGLEERVSMIEGNVLHVDLTPATVVTMFLMTGSNERLKPNLEKDLKPGSRVVSNEFPIKGWKPVEALVVKTGTMEHTIYVYEMGRTN
ncbi:MAG: methyltransferase domain-containing protein [Acidobacteriia bacterium]|nr:methyltransferase domain-containing protein [Terriglobia bacterium]